jgi:hypothetical protein
MAELLKEETTTALHRGIRTWRLGNLASRVRHSHGTALQVTCRPDNAYNAYDRGGGKGGRDDAYDRGGGKGGRDPAARYDDRGAYDRGYDDRGGRHGGRGTFSIWLDDGR